MNWYFVGDRPIYAQLVEQIQMKIMAGEYKAGQRLPSIRDLAADAAVNPNTMQKAFGELEQGGLVNTQRTSGRFITDDHERIEKMREQYAKKLALSFVEQMKTLGYGAEEIIALLSSTLKEGLQ